MKNSYLDFIKRRQNVLNESISNKNFDSYVDKISDLLKKHIKNIVPLVGYVETFSKDNEFISKQYIVINSKENVQMFQINWIKSSESMNPYSIDFFKDMDLAFTGKAKSNLTIQTLDSSIVYFLPIIWTVVNNKQYDLTDAEAKKLGRSIFNKNANESFYIGALKYTVINEKYSPEVDEYVTAKRRAWLDAEKRKNDSPQAALQYRDIADEFREIIKAIQGGAKTVDEIKLKVDKGNNITIKKSPEEQQSEAKFKETINDPEMVFKKMEGYVKMVIKGINPSVILCGAPGVGKTFRVKKLLKENGYEEEKNLYTIKGKCTPRVLYLSLYNYKDKGDIIVIDDADSLVGPKAPEDCINILKGALDSTEDEKGRLVTYGVSGKITDENGNELPKRFYYNGSVIIITNYNAGSLDTALRGRSYIQDIHFSTEDVLKIITNLMPTLSSDKLSKESKRKALGYLIQLNEEDNEMEVSIRTFLICATLFESMKDEDDMLTKEMIKEQMRLQADRRKNKY